MTDRHKFWLTDEVLDNLFRAICGDVAASATEAEEALAAIRALRDRARTVTNDASFLDAVDCRVEIKAINKLKELLP